MLLLLGADVWGRWFPTDVTIEDVVPRQVAMLMHATLDRVRATWEAEAATADRIRNEAATAVGVLVANNKRRMASAPAGSSG